MGIPGGSRENIKACLLFGIAYLFAINQVGAQGGETVFDVTTYGAKGDGKSFNEVVRNINFVIICIIIHKMLSLA